MDGSLTSATAPVATQSVAMGGPRRRRRGDRPWRREAKGRWVVKVVCGE